MKNSKSVIPFLMLFFLIAIGLPTISKKAANTEIVKIEISYEDKNKMNLDEVLQAQLNQ